MRSSSAATAPPWWAQRPIAIAYRQLTLHLAEGESWRLGSLEMRVIDVPGAQIITARLTRDFQLVHS